MNYDINNYLDWCNKRGKKSYLPDYFEKIRDEALYNATDISLITGLHKETVLNWFRTLKIQNQSASNSYKGYGKEFKQFIFNRPVVINPLKVKRNEYFLSN
jgi:hypothetical protein